jgi:hypothetical protein
LAKTLLPIAIITGLTSVLGIALHYTHVCLSKYLSYNINYCITSSRAVHSVQTCTKLPEMKPTGQVSNHYHVWVPLFNVSAVLTATPRRVFKTATYKPTKWASRQYSIVLNFTSALHVLLLRRRGTMERTQICATPRN